jgi:hypothetical protein
MIWPLAAIMDKPVIKLLKSLKGTFIRVVLSAIFEVSSIKELKYIIR